MNFKKNKPMTPRECGDFINSITMDLTQKCNLACEYCFAHTHRHKAKDMSWETAKKTIDWLFDPSTSGDLDVTISFWGGEPLMRWELLKKIVLYAKKKSKQTGKRVQFGGTTNVTLLTPEKFDFLEEHKIYFLLSIDGRKESHDRYRKFVNGEGSWDVIDKNADRILEKWDFYHVRLSYSAENIENFLEDIKYLYNKGFKDIAYSVVAESDWTEENLKKMEKAWREVADWYIDMVKKGEQIKIKDMDDPCMKMYNPVGDQKPCGAGRGYVAVTIDGAIYPCHRFNKFDDPRPWYEREVCLGHIKYGILNTEWRDNFVNWSLDSMDKDCDVCEAKGLTCTGGCWATNWDFTGTLNKNPKVVCHSQLLNIKNARYINNHLEKLGINKFKNKHIDKNMQSCICYNTTYTSNSGRKYTMLDMKNPDRICKCNMASYNEGEDITTPKCDCYNTVYSKGVSFFDNVKE